MKKLIIGVTSLSLLLMAAAAVVVSKFLEPSAEAAEKEDAIQ